MPPATIVKYAISSPADDRPLASLAQDGYTTDHILGVVGKTEGNGCVNDFSRTLASHVWESRIPPTAISIFSGGTEGVLSPHISFVLRSDRPTGLLATVGRTRLLRPWEIGTIQHVQIVAATLQTMLAVESISPEDVQLVLIKCPLLTSEKVAAITASDRKPLTEDTYESMVRSQSHPLLRELLTRTKACSRYAGAVAIGQALGEITADDTPAALDMGNFHTAKASCSSGAELDDCHILVLANDRRKGDDLSLPTYQAFTTVMESAIDFGSLHIILQQALTPAAPYQSAKLVQIFAKAEADPRGLVAGKFRHTMLTDSDLHSTRHARAAVGGLIAGVTGDCHIYVSGGAEGQGPKGGGGVCVVVRWDV